MFTILGAVLVGLIIQGGLYKFMVARNIGKYKAVGISAVVFVAIYVVVGAFGAADGGPPNFAWSVGNAIPAGVIVSLIILLGIWRGRKSETDST